MEELDKKWIDRIRERARQDDPEALYTLGEKHLTGGTFVPQDYEKALKYLWKSAKLGYSEAYNVLGQMHEGGKGVERDVDEAVRLYREGAKLGNTHCKEILWQLINNGVCVPKNESESLKLLLEAARQGSQLSQTSLQRISKRN